MFSLHTHIVVNTTECRFLLFFIITEKSMFLLEYNDLELCFLLNIYKNLCFLRENIQELYWCKTQHQVSLMRWKMHRQAPLPLWLHNPLLQQARKDTGLSVSQQRVNQLVFNFAREDESDDCSDEVRFLDVGGLLQEDGDGEELFLTQHQHCAAHTLNLIATNEIHKAASNGPSRKLYSAMAKCSSIWNEAHRSSLATEVIQEIANMNLTVPLVTRWNSEFRAITKLAGLPEEKLREICDTLEVPRLHPQECAFLKE